MEYINLIGFRYDEPQRVAKNKSRWQKVKNIYPLYKNKINKLMVNEYWKGKPYNLEIPAILGNCTLCFMKGKNNIINILKHDPNLADIWINDEENSEYKYFKDISIKELKKISQMPDLFSAIKLDLLTPAYDCACTT